MVDMQPTLKSDSIDDGHDMSDDDETITSSDFQGCYCLVSRSEKKGHKGRTYIGYTVNPNRRIKQHNSGRLKGGAKKTDSRGPWYVLQFEWAWQNPQKSRRLRDMDLKKKNNENPLAHRLRIACSLMRTRPWSATPLTLRWLIPECRLPIPSPVALLPHMSEDFGLVPKESHLGPHAVVAKKSNIDEDVICACCNVEICDKLQDLTPCPSSTCSQVHHLMCIERSVPMDQRNTLLRPIRIEMPCCKYNADWSDIVRMKRACEKLLL